MINIPWGETHAGASTRGTECPSRRLPTTPLAVVHGTLSILSSPFRLSHHGIARRGAMHGLTGSKRLARCLPPSSHVTTLPKNHGGNPNPTSSMKLISHMYSSHKELASTSKTLIKLSLIAQLANFESSSFVLQTSYVLQTSIALPATDGRSLLVPSSSQGRSETMQGRAPHHYFATQ